MRGYSISAVELYIGKYYGYNCFKIKYLSHSIDKLTRCPYLQGVANLLQMDEILLRKMMLECECKEYRHPGSIAPAILGSTKSLKMLIEKLEPYTTIAMLLE